MHDNRRASGPPAFPPQPPPQAPMHRNQSTEHLQPPQPQPRQQPSPQPGSRRATPSPQPPQSQFASPAMPQPRALPAHARGHNIFTPIDDSRSMLAQHWGQTSNADVSKIDPAIIKLESGGPRSASIDSAAVQREREMGRANGVSPRPPPARNLPRSPKPPAPQRTASSSSMPGPSRINTGQSGGKRPTLKVQIPSEQSGDEGATGSAPDEASALASSEGRGPQHQQPHGVVLPPPSPSAGALLSAGAQGPPNPFARPAPPMSTNPHAMNRDANHIETPISALPSRFMSDNLLPSPSTFYPEWGFGRGDGNMLPSPLNFQTPVVAGGGWRDEDRKRERGGEDFDGGGSAGPGEAKRGRH